MTTTLITGANKGIGYATAKRLQHEGHQVIVGARDVARGRAAAESIGARFVQLDVTDEVSVRRAAAEIDRTGGIDVLVNNAGIEARLPGNIVPTAQQMTGDLMLQTFDVNTFGPVRMLAAFLPQLLRSPHPVVVNLSSGLASLTVMSTPEHPGYPYPGVAYPASKAALNMVTVQYAKAFPQLRINAVEPGFTRTDLNGNTGHQTVDEAAEVVARLAMVGPDGPTGTFTDRSGPLPW